MRKSPSVFVRLAAIAGLALLAGCASIPAYQQGLLSRPGMAFDDSAVGSTAVSLASQVEPGNDSNGGSQSSGCSVCR